MRGVTFLRNFARALHELFTSKKFLTAVGGALAAYNTTGDARKAIVGLAIALLLGQGAADFGKVAAGK